MKFHQFPLGESFEFGGQPYRKTAPLLGTHEQTGQQRLIPRSAEITPVDHEPVSTAEKKEDATALSADAVLTALNDCHSACITGLTELLNGDQLENASTIIDKARRDFCRALSLSPKVRK